MHPWPHADSSKPWATSGKYALFNQIRHPMSKDTNHQSHLQVIIITFWGVCSPVRTHSTNLDRSINLDRTGSGSGLTGTTPKSKTRPHAFAGGHEPNAAVTAQVSLFLSKCTMNCVMPCDNSGRRCCTCRGRASEAEEDAVEALVHAS